MKILYIKPNIFFYKHHIPFIILRPRVDLISRRKRFEKLKRIQEEESSNRNSVSEYSKNFKDNESSSNTSNIKFGKKYSVQITQLRGRLVLTKMPEKTEENTRNKILNIAFNKAKDAARVIRRLEYSYGMRTNFIFSKQVYQTNAKVIQDWPGGE